MTSESVDLVDRGQSDQPAPGYSKNCGASVWTVQKILQWSIEFLKTKGSPTARLDSEILLAHTLGLSRVQLYTGYDKPVLEREREPLRGFLRRRGAGEPVAYIVGSKDFMGLGFQVSQAVLIPRPDTEILVEAVMAAFSEKNASLKILDVGTGSGCIAISLKKLFPLWDVSAWDISCAALDLARRNAALHDCDGIRFLNCDALKESAWEASGDESLFDAIASNPPYIGAHERSSLPDSVNRYEPGLALFAAENGLVFYSVFARQALRRLKPGGLIFLEVGSTQANDVSRIFEKAGWQDLKILKDYGKNDRVLIAKAPHGGAD
jgi:release factor glutamine methyltransferase